jgi:hypothetical protein
MSSAVMASVLRRSTASVDEFVDGIRSYWVVMHTEF